jgi:hypothetical protein
LDWIFRSISAASASRSHGSTMFSWYRFFSYARKMRRSKVSVSLVVGRWGGRHREMQTIYISSNFIHWIQLIARTAAAVTMLYKDRIVVIHACSSWF